jgi:glutathione synthase
MSLRVAVQMDPLGAINPASDSTLLLMREAASRGHALWHYTPDKLSWRDGKISAHAHPVTLSSDPKNFYTLGEMGRIDIAEMDVVLLRQDPPFNMQYITTTYLLEQLEGPLVVNHPTAVRDYPEKLFPLVSSQFMPPTLITADPSQIEDFRREHKDIVIKPLYGYGGRAILRLKPEDENFHALMEMQFAYSKEAVVVQKFLPEVKTGDRRIVMIDGEFAGIMGRIPAQGEIRANFRVGGTAAKVELTARQREICEALGPVFKKEGLIFVGLDTIGDWLTEVNITSPTGLSAMNKIYGKKLESEIWNAIEKRL